MPANPAESRESGRYVIANRSHGEIIYPWTYADRTRAEFDAIMYSILSGIHHYARPID